MKPAIYLYDKEDEIPNKGTIQLGGAKLELTEIRTPKQALETELEENTAYSIVPGSIDNKNCWDYGSFLVAIVYASYNKNLNVAALIREDRYEELGKKGWHEIDKTRSYVSKLDNFTIAN